MFLVGELKMGFKFDCFTIIGQPASSELVGLGYTTRSIFDSDLAGIEFFRPAFFETVMFGAAEG